MLSIFRRLMKNERGASAIEYALIGSFVALAIVTAATVVGEELAASLERISTEFARAPRP